MKSSEFKTWVPVPEEKLLFLLERKKTTWFHGKLFGENNFRGLRSELLYVNFHLLCELLCCEFYDVDRLSHIIPRGKWKK